MKIFIIVLFVTVCIIFSCTNPGKLYIEANYQAAEVMLVDFIEYIENDPSLSPEDKEIRVKAVQEWHKLIMETFKDVERVINE